MTILLILNILVIIWIVLKYERDKEQRDIDISHILGMMPRMPCPLARSVSLRMMSSTMRHGSMSFWRSALLMLSEKS